MRRLLKPTIVAALCFLPLQLFAGQNKDHNDAFVPGPAGMSKLAQEVRHQLVMLPYYSIFDDLAFRVDGGSVTLLGAVTRPVLKSDAGNVVKGIEGVDDQIRRAVARVVYGDPIIGDRYGNRALPSIHIIVKNGDVTLEGVVANQGDKNLINVRVNGVPNVFKVTNNLQVDN